MTNTTEHKPKPVAAEAPHAKTKSKGEKFFDRVVYGGIAGLGTFIITVPVTYFLKHQPTMKPYYEKAVDWLHTKLPASYSRETANKILSTTALMQGGNLMLLPVGYLEKHKVQIVKGLNVTLDDPTPADQIEMAPKQTWKSLIESRGLAWLMVFGAFKAAEKYAARTLVAFEEDMGDLACRVFRKDKMRKIVETIDGVDKIMERETKTYLFGKIGAWDMFATAAAVTLAYIGGHFFARKQEQKKEVRAARRQSAMGEPRRDDATIVATPAEESLNRSEPVAKIGGDRQHQGLMAAAPELQVGINA